MKISRTAASLAFGVLALGAPEAGAAPVPAATGAPTAGQQQVYRCILAPQPALCAATYQKALRNPSPESDSIRQAYESYARYLKAGSALTGADRQYLKANRIDVPDDLSPLETSGLHNVINDAMPKGAEERKEAVINFISRAEEANIYCGLQSCGGSRTS